MTSLLRTFFLGAALFCGAALAADAPQPAQPDHGALYAQLQQADYIAEGAKDPKSLIYVFFDANCLYCHYTWIALRHYEKVGLQVRWVPVAVLKKSSLSRAAAIMDAPDRTAAFLKNETGFNSVSMDGGIAPARKPQPGTVDAIQNNTFLMQKFGAPGTPALVWKDKSGRVGMIVGVPRLELLPKITGLPEQWIDEPELDAYR